MLKRLLYQMPDELRDHFTKQMGRLLRAGGCDPCDFVRWSWEERIDKLVEITEPTTIERAIWYSVQMHQYEKAMEKAAFASPKPPPPPPPPPPLVVQKPWGSKTTPRKPTPDEYTSILDGAIARAWDQQAAKDTAEKALREFDLVGVESSVCIAGAQEVREWLWEADNRRGVVLKTMLEDDLELTSVEEAVYGNFDHDFGTYRNALRRSVFDRRYRDNTLVR